MEKEIIDPSEERKKNIKDLQEIINDLSETDKLAAKALKLVKDKVIDVSSKVDDVSRDVKNVNNDHVELKREFYDFRDDELERRELTTTQVNNLHAIKDAKVREILGIREGDDDPDYLIFNGVLSRMIWTAARKEGNLGKPISRTANGDYKKVCNSIANFDIPPMYRGYFFNSVEDLKEWALQHDGNVRKALICQLKKPVYRGTIRERGYDRYL